MANDQGLRKAIFQEAILRLPNRTYNTETKGWDHRPIDDILADAEKIYQWVIAK